MHMAHIIFMSTQIHAHISEFAFLRPPESKCPTRIALGPWSRNTEPLLRAAAYGVKGGNPMKLAGCPARNGAVVGTRTPNLLFTRQLLSVELQRHRKSTNPRMCAKWCLCCFCGHYRFCIINTAAVAYPIIAANGIIHKRCNALIMFNSPPSIMLPRTSFAGQAAPRRMPVPSPAA